MLTPENTALVVIDVQGRLASLMHEREALVRNLRILIQGARILELPIFWLEQYPKGLGPTVPEIAELLSGQEPLAKMSFSACGQEEFMKRLNACDRRRFLLAGIEAHVCVYQTARDLLGLERAVEIVIDAISSRTEANKKVGVQKMLRAGAELTSVETALFELMRTAEASRFKEVAKLVR
jgi:nicotinamidase-related amidase